MEIGNMKGNYHVMLTIVDTEQNMPDTSGNIAGQSLITLLICLFCAEAEIMVSPKAPRANFLVVLVIANTGQMSLEASSFITGDVYIIQRWEMTRGKESRPEAVKESLLVMLAIANTGLTSSRTSTFIARGLYTIQLS